MSRTATAPARRRADRRPAHGGLAGGLAAARLPRRGAARPARADPGGRRPSCPSGSAEPLRACVARLQETPLTELEADYVETFDNRRRHNLFLTYFAHGDTRKRGMALLRFKQTYLASGFELTDAELPDHLCVVLEYAATVDRERGPPADPRPPRRARAAPDLARRGRLALGRCRRGGHRHAAAAAGRRVGGRAPARRRGTARGGGRPHAVRDPRLRPGPGATGRPHAAADAVVPTPSARGAR